MDIARTSEALTQDAKLAVVTLDALKAQLRIRHVSEDTLLKGYIEAAFDFLDGPDGWLNGYCLLKQDWTLYSSYADLCDDRIELPLRPVIDTGAVSFGSYDEVGGSYASMPAAAFAIGYDYEACVLDLFSPRSPSFPRPLIPRAFRLTFSAGWDSAAKVPSPLKQAILMLAAHFYQNREATLNEGTAASVSKEVVFGLRALAGRYRFSPDHS